MSIVPSHDIITTTNRLFMAIFVILHLLFIFESLLSNHGLCSISLELRPGRGK